MKAALLFLAGSLSAQPLVFTKLDPASAKPSPRFDGAIAYDAANRQLFLFGGQDSAPRNDLWIYSPDRNQWIEAQPTGAKPPARFGHTLIYDPPRARLIAFGGQAGSFFSDVWAYDIAANSWRQLSRDQAGPSRRYGHSAILDPARDRMVISHGFTDAGRFDDTWALDFATNTWLDLSPPSGRPLRRCLHHAAYNPAGREMLLYGGCASGFGLCPLGDLWSFDLESNRWTERKPAAPPPPRQHYGLAFDAPRGKMVVFGGSGAGFLNDVWEYDPAAASWSQPPLQGAAPEARQRHEAAYAADQGAAYFFGGVTASGPSNELWRFGPAPIATPIAVVNAFSGESGAIAPGEIVSIYGSRLEGALTWNGQSAPIYYASATQINTQAPLTLTAAAEAELKVGAASIRLSVAAARPGLHANIYDAAGIVNGPSNPLEPGGIIIVFATGHGLAAPASAVLCIDGQPAAILYAGPTPGAEAVLQINARAPESAPSGLRAVTLSIGGVESPPVKLAIR